MRRSARLVSVTVLLSALSGCAVTLHGHQTAGGGTTATTTGGSIHGGARIGNARIGGSFGTPPTAHAPGGQLALSKGASAVLVLGLVIAGTVEMISDWFAAEPPQREAAAADGISRTCSCYGWQPGLTPVPPPQ